MKFWDLVRIANRNLLRNKLRTFLTIAAIVVGSFTLTMTNGVGDGMRAYVENQIKNIESDTVVFVHKKFDQQNRKGDSPPEYREDGGDGDVDPAAYAVSLAQMENLLKEMPGVKSITPRYQIVGEYITLEDQKKYKVELGTLSEGIVQKTEVGSTITGPGQIVIPLGLARTFDPEISSLIGKQATVAYKAADKTIKTVTLKIVGVATKGLLTNVNSFVDSGTAATIYNDQEHEASMAGKFLSFSVQLTSADEDKINALKAKLDEKGFEADTSADQRKKTYDAVGIIKLALGAVAMIALLAASFGIINTLVIAVLERTKEIGLQKALGMSGTKIFATFSLESVFIGFWGALIGSVAGTAVGYRQQRAGGEFR